MPWALGPVLMYVGRGQYDTVGRSHYVGRDQVFEIEDRFRTDLASSPRIFWALIPPDGAYEDAAVLHDWLCVQQEQAYREGRRPAVSSQDTDGLFRRVMAEAGVGFVTRWIMWAAVRLGALLNPARRHPWGWRDAPLVAAITLAMLAAVLTVWVGLYVVTGLLVAAVFG